MKYIKIIKLKYKIGHHSYCAYRNKKVISRSVHEQVVEDLLEKLHEVMNDNRY